MKPHQRKTAISVVNDGSILLRGYRIDELAGRISWGAAVLLTLTGELPDERTEKLMEAILVSLIDHGPTPASALAACTVASTGASLASAVAAGVLGIASSHGGAIEGCMSALKACKKGKSGADVVKEYRERGERVPGFGHRQHSKDPRAVRLFDLGAELGFQGEYVRVALEMESAISESLGRPVPINADGAIAAMLCEIGFPERAANGVFMMARVPGLIAHALEEQERNAPLRPIGPDAYEYDGPPERDMPAVKKASK